MLTYLFGNNNNTKAKAKRNLFPFVFSEYSLNDERSSKCSLFVEFHRTNVYRMERLENQQTHFEQLLLANGMHVIHSLLEVFSQFNQWKKT